MAKIPDDMEKRMKMIREAQESLKAFNDLLRATKELEDNIAYIEGKRLEIERDMLDTNAQIRAYEEGHIKLTNDQVNELKKKSAALKYGLEIEEKTLDVARNELMVRKEAVAEVNKLNLTLNSTYNITKKLGEEVLKQTGYFLQQQKGVKITELSMGIMSNQAKGFRNNIYQTSISTTQIGVNTKELAKMQGTYADNVGRAVQLNEEQLQAVAQIGKGTMLGTEAAAELAANFEQIGIGAEGTRDYIEDTLQLATKMGISSNKTIKNIQKNFKLLNKYNFKGGVEGFGKMAALATKFKFEMESIAGFADNLMTPEGAVEVASKLQVLGGEWAKLGDPFELMYRSRNDITGLTEDVINATKATATFDESTGEFRISPMELQRLREVANVTGMNAEELAEMAKQTAKFDRIEALIPSTFSEEDKGYLSSLAQFDKKTGKYKIQLTTESGDKINENVDELKKITPALIKSQMSFEETLKDRAKNSMTFNERFLALSESFKSGLLPAFEEIASILEKSITWAEPFVKGVAEFMAEWPKTTAAIGGFLAGMALIGDEVMWFFRGQLLGKGFNTTASSGGSGLPNLTGGPNGKSSPIGGGRFGKFGNVGKGGMTFGKSAMKGLKVGGGLGIASLGINAGRGMMDDPDSDVGKGLGVLGDAAEWASYGAMIGSVIPGIGTLAGGLIGGAGGALKGLFDEGVLGDDSKPKSNPLGDFIIRPDATPVSFSPDDTVVGAKVGGPIDKMLGQVDTQNATPGNNIVSIDSNEALVGVKGIDEFNSMFKSKTPASTGGSAVEVNFKDPIKIEGKIEVTSGNQSEQIDLKDPILMQNLSRIIRENLNMAISGGKLASNPVSA